MNEEGGNIPIFGTMELFIHVVALKSLKERSDVPSSRELPLFTHLHLVFTEPILQWNLGTVITKDNIKKLFPQLADLVATKCPCANDVALLGFLLNPALNGKGRALMKVRSEVLDFGTAGMCLTGGTC